MQPMIESKLKVLCHIQLKNKYVNKINRKIKTKIHSHNFINHKLYFSMVNLVKLKKRCESGGLQVIILRYLTGANPYSCFAFNWHCDKKSNPEKHFDYAFRTSGRCTFSDCKITFKIFISSFI